MQEVPQAGVVAASGGNHGAAVAYAARKLGLAAKIFVPRIAYLAKVARIRAYGADVVVGGDDYADALAASELWTARVGAMAVHAFDQTETLLGQGTIGIELEEEAPGIETLLIPVGGGGLIGGIAAWYSGKIKVIGVEPEASPTLSVLAAMRPVNAEVGGIAARLLFPSPGRRGSSSPLRNATSTASLSVPDEAIGMPGARSGRRSGSPRAGQRGGLCGTACRPLSASGGERIDVLVSGGNTAVVDFTR